MDRGQQDTEDLLKQAEKRINEEYKKAMDEMEDELTDYLERFEKKDEKWREWVESGQKTAEEYQQWRTGQMAVGRRWQDQINTLAVQMNQTNQTAQGIIRKYTPEMYADNFNWATYQIEKDTQLNTSFNLVNSDAVERLMRDDPDVLPPPGKKVSQEIAEGRAIRWNKQQLQSVMTQSILQGDSIPKMANRLATTVGEKNRKAAIRNARTMATGAQNAGRVDAYKRMQSKGVKIRQQWDAVHDNRTRHSHRWIDGEIQPVGEAFSNGCEYPGDPKGDPAEIYNCRCRLKSVIDGLTPRARQYMDTSGMDGMSYDEWRNAKAKSQDIESQEKKGKAIKASYIKKYRGG